MIRLPTTAIILGDGDLKDFERRERQRKVKLRNHSPCLGAEEGPRFDNIRQTQSGSSETELLQEANEKNPLKLTPPMRPIGDLNTLHLNTSRDKIGQDSESFQLANTFEEAEANPIDVLVQTGTSLDNPDIQAHPPSPTTKEGGFYYGGFTESTSMVIPSRSSTRDGASKPQNSRATRVQGIGPRGRPHRSSLFLSQTASTCLPMLGEAPRVDSRVATHDTPGIIFSQPSRRPPRPGFLFGQSRQRPPRYPPRSFRHQTNSFSFDSAGRSSTTHEQEYTSSDLIDDSNPRQTPSVSFDEEIRGRALRLSTATSSESLYIESTAGEDQLVPASSPNDPQSVRGNQSPIFPSPFGSEDEGESKDIKDSSRSPSPQLSLPLKYSAPGPILSSSGALHGQEDYIPSNTHASPIKTSSSLAFGRIIDTLEQTSSPPSGRKTSSTRLLSQLRSAYRSRSPITNYDRSDHPSSTSSSLPTPVRIAESSRDDNAEMPRSYRVYNDAYSPRAQPQTPAHLPEARHQSRFHPSVTTPARRGSRSSVATPSRIINNYDGVGSELRERPPQMVLGTLSRRGTGRSDSPVGELSRGFHGLYGGRENGDHEYSWAEGIRYDNVEVRLWGLRDARNDGRSLNETPEREDWRTGLR